MPIPSDPAGSADVASTVLVLFRQIHDQIREEIQGFDEAGLNWTPGPGTNSVATIIAHVVGSEAETIRSVVGLVDQRDREAEFSHPWQTLEQVTSALEQADLLMATMGPRIDGDRLRTRVALPTLSPEEERSGLSWLVGNYGHAREHVGHIQLTMQLYRLGRPL
jgi:DinB superfamily